MDGATAATYERIRRHGRFADVVAGIRALGDVRRRRGRPRLWLAMLVMASNVDEVPALIDLAADAGADGVHVSSLYPWDHDAIEELARAEELLAVGATAVEALLAEARRRARARGIEFSSQVELGSSPPPIVASDRESAPHDPRQHLAWPCSEPWSTINVNARGEVRTCCFNDQVMGTLGDASFDEIWNGHRYRTLRRQHLDLEAPSSCARCVGAGRLKRSPFLPSETTAGAPRQRALPVVVSPDDGEACDRRLVVLGASPRPRWRQRVLRALESAPLPAEWRGWAGRRVEPSPLPDFYIDGELVARAADSGSHDGARWAIVIEAPFVSSGSHRLTVRAPAAAGGETWAERRLQFVELQGSEPIVATRNLSICLPLDRPEPVPLFTIAGRERRSSVWLCGTYADAWRGFAVLDLADVDPGTYSVEIELTRHPARSMRFRRIVVRAPGS
jgi:hypothetical protein